MQNNLDTQRASAAPRRVWVTPELRSLDVKGTLNASLPGPYEFDPVYDPSGDTFYTPS